MCMATGYLSWGLSFTAMQCRGHPLSSAMADRTDIKMSRAPLTVFTSACEGL